MHVDIAWPHPLRPMPLRCELSSCIARHSIIDLM
jgi:hypothetical protein